MRFFGPRLAAILGHPANQCQRVLGTELERATERPEVRLGPCSKRGRTIIIKKRYERLRITMTQGLEDAFANSR
jgi:hypothetical protein